VKEKVEDIPIACIGSKTADFIFRKVVLIGIRWTSVRLEALRRCSEGVKLFSDNMSFRF
jgi:hypothetical protein